jgi:hypothetical protein
MDALKSVRLDELEVKTSRRLIGPKLRQIVAVGMRQLKLRQIAVVRPNQNGMDLDCRMRSKFH